MAHPVDVYVGKRLRERRNMMGLSQENLADTVGITFQQVQKYERGANRLSASRLYDFARKLDVPVNYFFDDYEQTAQNTNNGGMAESATAFEHEDLSSREMLELAKAFRRIRNSKVKKSVTDLIRAIADGDAVV